MSDLTKMDYYDIYEELHRILSITPGIVKIFQDLKDMRRAEKPYNVQIDYIYELLEKHNLIPDPATLEEKKSDAKAEEFRGQGNALYIRKTRNVDAIVAYNKSICYAESKENLSISLANRSAVFFQMQMYPECMESIKLAREAGVPERFKEKLDRRKVECKEKIKKTQQKTEQVFVPKIELPVNEKIPFLAKCLSLREDSTYGRYVVAEEDIPAGTIIALEESFCKVLMDSEIYLRCANCLAEVPHLLLPCSDCTTTMFCSKKCEVEAYQNFHAIECPISGSLLKLFKDDEPLRLVFRIVITAFLAFKENIEEMEAALEKMDREKKNVFSFDWSQELSPEEHYTPLHTLCKNEDMRDSTYLFKKYIIACLMLKLLQQNPMCSQRFLTSSTEISMLKNLIFRHLLIVSFSSQSFRLLDDITDFDTPSQYGCTLLRFCSLINHSCSPNVTIFTHKTTCGIITIKNIASGDQLFDNYGIPYWLMPKIMRRRELLRRFGFLCKCVACTENYPMFNVLVRFGYTQTVYHDLPVGTSFEACKTGFQKAINYLRNNGLCPTAKNIYAEEALKFNLDFLCGNIPLRVKDKIDKSTL